MPPMPPATQAAPRCPARLRSALPRCTASSSSPSSVLRRGLPLALTGQAMQALAVGRRLDRRHHCFLSLSACPTPSSSCGRVDGPLRSAVARPAARLAGGDAVGAGAAVVPAGRHFAQGGDTGLRVAGRGGAFMSASQDVVIDAYRTICCPGMSAGSAPRWRWPAIGGHDPFGRHRADLDRRAARRRLELAPGLPADGRVDGRGGHRSRPPCCRGSLHRRAWRPATGRSATTCSALPPWWPRSLSAMPSPTRPSRQRCAR